MSKIVDLAIGAVVCACLWVAMKIMGPYNTI